MAGADEIAHLPMLGEKAISPDDARLAASRSVIVDTTCEILRTLPPDIVPSSERAEALTMQPASLKLLHDSGVKLAIGTDTPSDTSHGEVAYLRGLKVFDDLTLLNMWTETTPQSIFPNRKIGALEDGFEASFLALDGNPLEDWKNTDRIRVRFKQGYEIQP